MPKSKPKSFSNFVKDLTGKKFGRLTVIGFSGLDKRKKAQWRCLCNCGTIVISQSKDLQSGAIKSCKCWRREILSSSAYKHGHAVNSKGLASAEYNIWTGMIQRCMNPKCSAYKWYGARGIKVCTRWRKSFPSFLEDMGLRPSPELSIDRIDNEGNYEPGNCRWATAKQQAANRRRPKARRKT